MEIFVISDILVKYVFISFKHMWQINLVTEKRFKWQFVDEKVLKDIFCLKYRLFHLQCILTSLFQNWNKSNLRQQTRQNLKSTFYMMRKNTWYVLRNTKFVSIFYPPQCLPQGSSGLQYTCLKTSITNANLPLFTWKKWLISSQDCYTYPLL